MQCNAPQKYNANNILPNSSVAKVFFIPDNSSTFGQFPTCPDSCQSRWHVQAFQT